MLICLQLRNKNFIKKKPKKAHSRDQLVQAVNKEHVDENGLIYANSNLVQPFLDQNKNGISNQCDDQMNNINKTTNDQIKSPHPKSEATTSPFNRLVKKIIRNVMDLKYFMDSKLQSSVKFGQNFYFPSNEPNMTTNNYEILKENNGLNSESNPSSSSSKSSASPSSSSSRTTAFGTSASSSSAATPASPITPNLIGINITTNLEVCNRQSIQSINSTDSKSDFSDPVYSVIKYSDIPNKSLLCSSTTDLLFENEWISQSTLSSNTHIYCELMKTQMGVHNTSMCKFEKRSTQSFFQLSSPNVQDRCTVQTFADEFVTSSEVNTPKLPARLYGESTVNLVNKLRHIVQSDQSYSPISRSDSSSIKFPNSPIKSAIKCGPHRYHRKQSPVKKYPRLMSDSKQAKLIQSPLIADTRNIDQPMQSDHLIEPNMICRSDSAELWTDEYFDGINSSYVNGVITNGCKDDSIIVNRFTHSVQTNNDQLRHIDSEDDLVFLPSNLSFSNKCQLYHSSFLSGNYNALEFQTPSHRIYLPSCPNTQRQLQSKHSKPDRCFLKNLGMLVCNSLENITKNGNGVKNEVNLSPLMERSMEDDEYRRLIF